MKLKEYLEKLNKMAEETPMLLQLDVITSKDDEGNGYNPVYCDPFVGWFEDGEFDDEDHGINSICVN